MCDAEKVGFIQLNFYSMLKYAYSLTKHYLVGFLHLNNQRYNFIMNDKKVLKKEWFQKLCKTFQNINFCFFMDFLKSLFRTDLVCFEMFLRLFFLPKSGPDPKGNGVFCSNCFSYSVFPSSLFVPAFRFYDTAGRIRTREETFS